MVLSFQSEPPALPYLWKKQNETVIGDNAGDTLGWAVDLLADASTLVVGAPGVYQDADGKFLAIGSPGDRKKMIGLDM